MRAAVYTPRSACAAEPHTRAPHGKRTDPRGNGTSGLGYSSGSTSHTNRVSKRDRKQSHANKSGKNVQAALEKRGNKDDGRMVDCPVYKHHIMHRSDPPCQGCHVEVMSQVRSHLDPNRSRTHRNFPEFVKHCSRCEHDFITELAYDTHKEEGCGPEPQIRNDIVLSWARMYLALYPNAHRIPVPWTNETGWLTDSEEHRCRAPFVNTVTSSPFLDRHQSRDSPHIQTPPAIVNPPAYDGVVDFLLSEVLNPMLVQTNHSTAATTNPDRQDEASPHASSTDAAASGAQQWQHVLHDFSTQQRPIQHGATYFTTDQLLSAARECEFMYGMIMAMHQAQYSQPTQIQIYPAVAQPSIATEASNPAYTTPLRPQYLAAHQYTTPGASTQPSTHGYNTGSSHYDNSTPTQPSSTSAPGFLDPFLSNYRGSSVPTTPIPETLAMRREPSRFSLPEQVLIADDEEEDDFSRPPYYS
jgi:hypothetical protein